MQDSCWLETCDVKRANSGSWTDARPFASSIRRSLQREYLGLVEPLVRVAPGGVLSPDLHAMVQFIMQKLSGEIDGVLETGKLDFASEAHLSACKSRIDRMLAPELKEYGSF